MVAELEQAGKLRESVYAAQELTGEAMVDPLHQGLTHDQAWELVREDAISKRAAKARWGRERS